MNRSSWQEVIREVERAPSNLSSLTNQRLNHRTNRKIIEKPRKKQGKMAATIYVYLVTLGFGLLLIASWRCEVPTALPRAQGGTADEAGGPKASKTQAFGRSEGFLAEFDGLKAIGIRGLDLSDILEASEL